MREWAEAALAARERLSSRGLAETLVGAGEIARFAGDLDRALELKAELASAEGELQRPNWRAATLADLCEIELDRGDLAGARAYAEQSAAAGGGARAELCFAELALRADVSTTPSRTAAPRLAGGGAFNHACALELLGEAARRPETPTWPATASVRRCGRSWRSATAAASPTASRAWPAWPLPPAWTTARAACSARPSACARRGGGRSGRISPSPQPYPRARPGAAR